MTDNRHPHSAPVEVILSNGLPLCRRCEGEGILSARLPYGWSNTKGHHVPGVVTVVLCQRCDLNDPAAGALITWFTVHGELTPANLEAAAPLIQAWANTLTPPAFDQLAFDADLEAWRQGELDD